MKLSVADKIKPRSFEEIKVGEAFKLKDDYYLKVSYTHVLCLSKKEEDIQPSCDFQSHFKIKRCKECLYEVYDVLIQLTSQPAVQNVSYHMVYNRTKNK